MRPRPGAGLRAAGVAGTVLLCVAAGPGILRGQTFADEDAAQGARGERIYVTAFAGLLAPLNDLTTDPASFGTAMTSSLVLGAEGTAWLGPHWGIGLQGLYAPADLQLKPSDFQGAVPDDLGDADYAAAGATVLYRLSLPRGLSVIEPYFGAGVGLRRLSVDPIAEPEVEDVTNLAGMLTGGAFVRLSRGLAVRLEARDWISSFTSPTTDESRLQNDLSVTVGLGTAIP